MGSCGDSLPPPLGYVLTLRSASRSILTTSPGISILRIVRENPISIKVNFGGPQGRVIRRNYLAMKKTDSAGEQETESSMLKGLNAKTLSYTFEHPNGLLMSTQFSQPALVLMEMAEFENLKARGVFQSCTPFAGHSLGEYAALGACTSTLSFEDLLDLVFYRGVKMNSAVKRDGQGRTD